MSQLRVLCIAPFHPLAAAQLADHTLHRQMRAAARAGCRILTIVAVPYVPLARRFRPHYAELPAPEASDGMEIRFTRHLKLPSLRLHGLSTFLASVSLGPYLDRVVREFSPRVVHAYVATPAGHVALRLGRRHGLPVVCSFRGKDIHVYPHESRLSRRLTRDVILGADVIVGNSEALARDALALAGEARDFTVVHRGCDLNAFRFDPVARSVIRRELNIADRAPVFVFLGNVLPSKGIHELIDAFGTLRTRHTGAHLILVGRVPEPEPLRARIDRRGVTPAVHMPGLQAAEDVAAWLSAGDVFVLPSYREGMPNALLEAMACERPVVATRVGGIPEVVNDDVGMLVEPRDAEGLADALLGMVERRPRWTEMGREAREIIRREFDWDISGEQLRALYESVARPQSGA